MHIVNTRLNINNKTTQEGREWCEGFDVERRGGKLKIKYNITVSCNKT